MAQFDYYRASQEVDAILRSIGKYTHEKQAKTLVMDLLGQAFGAVKPFKDTFYENNGTSTEMLVLRGTMVTVVKRQNFNTPIDLWIPHDFPRSRPMMFIVPFDDMKIPKNHEHVGSDGRVYHSFLSDWNSNSTLAELLMSVSSVCGKKPPLVRVPAGMPVPDLASVIAAMNGAPQRPQYPSHHQPTRQPVAARPRVRVTAKPSTQPRHASQPNYPPPAAAAYRSHQPAPQVYTQAPATSMHNTAPPAYQYREYPRAAEKNDSAAAAAAAREAAARVAAEAKRKAEREKAELAARKQREEREARLQQQRTNTELAQARSQVTHCLQNEMRRIILDEEAGIAKLETLQQKLGMKSENVAQQIAGLVSYRSACHETLANIDREIQATAGWIEEQESRLQQGSVVEPADPKSAQLIRLVARAAATEDLMFELERALLDERIKVGRFLKLVRKHARAEFMDLALAHKVVEQIAVDDRKEHRS